MASRILMLRRADACVVCGSPLLVGTEAWWDATARAVTCTSCKKATAEPTPLQREVGQAGASAAREHQRRKHQREARTRKAHPRIGGLLLALRNAPQHEEAFRRGELGEQAVASFLQQRTAGGPTIILHDCGMPGGRGNIDHLAIAPIGVFVIDAKNYKGKVSVSNPLFAAPKLLIAGRDRAKLVDGLDRQVAAVRQALGANAASHVPVHGALCFTATADLPLLGTPTIRGHLLLYRKALAKRLNADGPLRPPVIAALAKALAAALPPA